MIEHSPAEASERAELALLYVPCGSEDQAAEIAGMLLNDRLIACANIYRSRALYTWQGASVDEAEWLLLCKTLISRADEVTARIEAIHSNEVPCILTVAPHRVNDAYREWVAGQLETPPDTQGDA